jgi:hypothetical protein
MYVVTIFCKDECIDSREFAIGTWKEIGYWLDHYGYIDPAYKINVRISHG